MYRAWNLFKERHCDSRHASFKPRTSWGREQEWKIEVVCVCGSGRVDALKRRVTAKKGKRKRQKNMVNGFIRDEGGRGCVIARFGCCFVSSFPMETLANGGVVGGI